MKDYGSTGAQRGPESVRVAGDGPAVLEIAWSDDGELLGVTLAGDPLTPNQARALRSTIIATVGADNALPHSAIDAWERRVWAAGTNRGEPC